MNAHLAADIRDMALDFPAGLRSELDAMLQLDVSSPAGRQPRRSGAFLGSITVLRCQLPRAARRCRRSAHRDARPPRRRDWRRASKDNRRS